MAAGFPTKSNFATGDVLTATQMNDLAGTVNLLSPTAKGSIKAGSAANTVTDIAVGADGTVLTADAASTGGVKWATASSGGMTLITEVALNNATGYSFTSIPSTYKQLYLIWSGIYHSTTGSSFVIRLNNDSGSNYDYQGPYSSAGGTYSFNEGSAQPTFWPGGRPMFAYSATDSSYISASKGIFLIDGYASTSYYKNVNFSYTYQDQSNGNKYSSNAALGRYNSTSAVSSIDIVRTSGTATLYNSSNTSIKLYGVS